MEKFPLIFDNITKTRKYKTIGYIKDQNPLNIQRFQSKTDFINGDFIGF